MGQTRLEKFNSDFAIRIPGKLCSINLGHLMSAEGQISVAWASYPNMRAKFMTDIGPTLDCVCAIIISTHDIKFFQPCTKFKFLNRDA